MQMTQAQHSAAALCALAVASVLLGALVSVRPGIALGVALIAVGVAIGAVVDRRAHVFPRRPVDVGLAAVVIFLPFAPYISALSPPIASVIRATLALYILLGLLFRVIPSQRPIGAHGRWIVLAFVAYQLVPLVAVPGTPYSAVRALNWVMFVPLAFVALDARSRRVLLAAALVSGAVLVLGVVLQMIGLLGFTWGGLSLGGTGQYEHHATRYTSFILNPNNLGLSMLILAIAVHAVTRERTTDWRLTVLGSVSASVCLVVVFMTSSRGALIGLVLVGFYWFAIARRTGHYPLVVGAAVVVAVLAVPVVAPSVAPTIDKTVSSVRDIFHGSDESAQARRLRWSDVVPRNANLITGVGYGGYGEVAPDVDVVGVSATAVSSSLTVDNAWLKLLLEEGLIGVLLFAAVMVAGVRSALAVMRRLDARVPAIIASSTLLLLVFQGISVDSFDINPWNAFLWLTLALSYPEPRLPRAASAPGAGVQETSAAAGGPFGGRVSHRAETA